MRYYELAQIVEYLKKFKKISDIYRVDNNVLRVDFDKEAIYFDLSRGDSKIYKRDDFIKIKRYSAPFDIVLQKRFKKSKILDISLVNQDKIIRIKVKNSSSYKEEISILQLEFTGRNTNAIILDENDTILEALRHIDDLTSYREIKPGRKLLMPPPLKKIDKDVKKIEDIKKYLYEVYESSKQKRLNSLKSTKIYSVNKQIKKLKDILSSLEDEERLKNLAQNEELKANLILANIDKIKPYEDVVKLEDFEKKPIVIELPKEAKTVSHMAKIFFSRAKKFKQKAKNIYIQRDNLKSKILFLQRMANSIKRAKNIEEIEMLFPKKSQKEKKLKTQNFERFVIDGINIFIGKNEKGNEELLKKSKSTDIWMHIKGMPSAHLIIQTKKEALPDYILKEAAKICVDFSVDTLGDYLVDYTQRRNVKIKEKAFVNYVNYKTIKVSKI